MLPRFDLYEPKTIAEACALKKEHNGRILAGGTDVVIDMHGGKEFPVIIDIKGIEELETITEDENTITFGALTRHRTIEESVFFKKYYSALWDGCSQVGSVQIRHRGTLGGNICNAVPSADSIGPLQVFDAVCTVASPEGEREVALKDFFIGPKKTVLGPDEILKSITIQKLKARSGSCYIKYGRRKAMDLALCGISCMIELDENDTIVKSRWSLTTAAPTSIRNYPPEEYLTGRNIKDVDLDELGKVAVKDAKPRSSWRSSAEFRIALLDEMAKRAYQNALSRALEAKTAPPLMSEETGFNVF